MKKISGKLKIVTAAVMLAGATIVFGATAGDSAKPYYDQGMNAWRNGSLNEAITIFSAVITNYPSSLLADDSQFMIGKCYYYRGLFTQAINGFEAVIVNYPEGNNCSKAEMWIGSCYFHLKKDYEKALEKYLIVVNKYPQTEEAVISQFQAGRCYVKLKRYKEAVEMFELIKNNFPDNKEYKRQADFEIKIIHDLMGG